MSVFLKRTKRPYEMSAIKCLAFDGLCPAHIRSMLAAPELNSCICGGSMYTVPGKILLLLCHDDDGNGSDNKKPNPTRKWKMRGKRSPAAADQSVDGKFVRLTRRSLGFSGSGRLSYVRFPAASSQMSTSGRSDVGKGKLN